MMLSPEEEIDTFHHINSKSKHTMFRAFSVFRKRLFVKNRFTSYLLYAIGEIVLVVIGILIALQINNLNGQKKERAKETLYLGSLKDELQDINRVATQRLNYELTMQSTCEKALFMINSDSINLDSLSAILNRISTRTSFVSYNPIFEEMKFSGNLALLQNNDFKNALTEFYEGMDYIAYVVGANNERFMDGLILFLMQYPFSDYGMLEKRKMGISRAPFKTIAFKEAHEVQSQLLSNPIDKFKLLNHLANRISVTAVHVSLYQGLKHDTDALSTLIDLELTVDSN